MLSLFDIFYVLSLVSVSSLIVLDLKPTPNPFRSAIFTIWKRIINKRVVYVIHSSSSEAAPRSSGCSAAAAPTCSSLAMSLRVSPSFCHLSL